MTSRVATINIVEGGLNGKIISSNIMEWKWFAKCNKQQSEAKMNGRMAINIKWEQGTNGRMVIELNEKWMTKCHK
jgi:hypothetical protein